MNDMIAISMNYFLIVWIFVKLQYMSGTIKHAHPRASWRKPTQLTSPNRVKPYQRQAKTSNVRDKRA